MKHGIRLIQYGDSGVGKTVRASEAARWGTLEIHDFDQQSDNLIRYLTAKDPNRLSQIRFISYSGKTNKQKVDSFAARIRGLADLRQKGKLPDIATLVVDSYTTLEQLYSEYLAPLYTPSNTGFGQPRQEVEVGGEKLTMMGSMDYSVLATTMKKVFDRFKDTGINIIVNCHERDPMESKKGIKQGSIKAAGQIRDMMPTEFNEVHRLFVDQNSQHRVQAKPNAMYMCKTSMASVPSNGILGDNSLSIFDSSAFTLESIPSETK